MSFFFKQSKKSKNGLGFQQKSYSQSVGNLESTNINKETSYPWSRQKLSGPCPFPRYGHASNSVVSKTGDIYIFGGLVKEKVKHDLWIIDTVTMMIYQIQAPGDCPSSRVGHAALVIGNAFIVFGGDTKTSKNIINDNSLYLLNTTSKIWTKATIYGQKPSGRYGHTLNILGTKIIIFGGQMETFFFNDLISFDLDTLNTPNAKWEQINPVTNLPPARTNHIMITYQEKLYLFGGTNGTQWFNDVWVFDYKNLSWKEVVCNGCIPQPREGHSASLVDDIIYIFGGRSLDGSDLGDLIAFKITTSRWYIFQNMGPSPSPRSGHTLTSFGQKIIVLGGEGSLNKAEDLSFSYILDTSKIRYPPEISIPNLISSPMIKSGSLLAPSPLSPMPPKPLSISTSKLQTSKSSLGVTTPSKVLQHSESLRTDLQTMSLEQFHKQRISRKHNRSKGFNSSKEDSSNIQSSASLNNIQLSKSQSCDQLKKTATNDIKKAVENDVKKVTTNDIQKNTNNSKPVSNKSENNNANSIKPVPSVLEKQVESTKQPEKHENLKEADSQISNKNVQHSKFKENMDELKIKNELLQVELNLIKNPDLEKSSAEVFFDSIERQNMIENLISLKKQITLLKLEILSQTKAASLKIAEAETEKNNCLQEAAYYKAKLAALSSPEILSTVENARIAELSSKLSSTMASRQELSEKLASLTEDIELEQRKIQQLEDMNKDYLKRIKIAESAHERVSNELNETRLAFIDTEEKFKEQISSKSKLELEKSQLHQENITLKQEIEDLKEKNALYLKSIEMINISVTMAEDRIANSENKSQKDQELRIELEKKVNQLTRELMVENNKKQILEEKIADLESKILNVTKEANIAREVMNEGILELLKKSKETISSENPSNDNQVKMLQEQLTSIKSLYSTLQSSSNKSVKDLVAALEKISQLEALNFASNREAQDLRDKMFDLLKELDTLKKDYRNMKTLLNTKDKDLEIAHIKASTISRLLEEYPLLEEQRNLQNKGVERVTRSTSISFDILDNNVENSDFLSKQNSTVKQKTETTFSQSVSSIENTKKETSSNQENAENNPFLSKNHNNTNINNFSSSNLNKKAFDLNEQRALDAERRLMESTQNYKERLQQLENDYQSAVYYMKGTETMLKNMKDELSKYKLENSLLKQENDNLKNYKDTSVFSFENHEFQNNEMQNNILTDEYAKIQTDQDILLQEKELKSLEEKYMNLKNTYYDNNKGSVENVISELEKTVEKLEIEPDSNDLIFTNISSDQIIFSDEVSHNKTVIPDFEAFDKINGLLINSSEDDAFLKEMKQSISSDCHNTHDNTLHSFDDTKENTIFKEPTFSKTSDTLDSLANELDQLRTRWESTDKNHKITSFD